MAPLENALKFQGNALSNKIYYPKRFTLILFYLFAFNTVFPLIDLPLLGLSITAVFFGLVALEIIVRSGYLQYRRYPKWFLLAYGIATSIFLSLAVNGLGGTIDLNTQNIVTVIRSIYWITVFVITMALFANLRLEDVHFFILILGASIMIMGVLRLYEAAAFGRVGPGTSRLLSQNTYGIIFSAFTPFGVAITFLARRPFARLLSIIGFISLVAAILVNGSRSSWLAVSVGILVLFVFFSISHYRSILPVIIVVALIAAGSATFISLLPSEVLEPIASRFETLERIEEDKSFLTRVLMQQKAFELFEENPVFGVGRGQFRNSYVELDFSGTPFSQDRSVEFNRIASHNSYIQFIAEQGVVGLFPFALLLLLLLFTGARAAIRLARNNNLWALAILAGFVSMSIHLWSIDNLQTTSTWFLYGLVAGMIEFERRQSFRISHL